jgi:hypothetical protein
MRLMSLPPHLVIALGVLFVAPDITLADTYTQASFSGAINSGNANVKAPFSGNGFTQGQTFSGSFVFDNQLVPAGNSGFTNVFFSSFPDIAAIPNASAFSFTFGSLSFNLGDNLNTLLPAGIQYNNGHFNGFEFITDFAFQNQEYQFRIDGSAITVKLLDGIPNAFDQHGFPKGGSLINAHINIGDNNLTGLTPFTPGVAVGQTPLPAALPLMGTVLGAGYLVSKWRRRRGAAGSTTIAAG